MKLKSKEERGLYNLLFSIKTYACVMDSYFNDRENIEKNKELYEAYKLFSNKVLKSFIDLGVVKK